MVIGPKAVDWGGIVESSYTSDAVCAHNIARENGEESSTTTALR